MAFTGTRCFEDRKTLLIERKVPLAACSSDWRSGFDSPSRFFAAALVLQLYNAVQSRKVPTGVAVIGRRNIIGTRKSCKTLSYLDRSSSIG